MVNRNCSIFYEYNSLIGMKCADIIKAQDTDSCVKHTRNRRKEDIARDEKEKDKNRKYLEVYQA